MEKRPEKTFRKRQSGSNRRYQSDSRMKKRKADKKEAFRQYANMPISQDMKRILDTDLQDLQCCVFDIETTGGNPDNNGITEICAFRVEKGVITDRFYSMVNPRVPIPPIVRRMTGINNRMVRDAPLIEEVMPALLDFIGNDILVSHNTIGDLKFLRYFAKQTARHTMENFFLCTHLLTEKLASDAPDKSLSGVAKYLGIRFDDDAHRAEADAKITFEVFEQLKSRLISERMHSVREAVRFQDDLESAMRLGWGIHKKDIDAIEARPGVLRFYNQRGDEIFLTSTFNCQKSIQTFKTRDLLPKQVLRSVLKSSKVESDYHPHIFLAMLHEASIASKVTLKVDPASWHQRTVTAFCIQSDQQNSSEIRVSVGIPDQETRYAFGPVYDKKEANNLIAKLSDILGGHPVRRGYQFSADQSGVILEFFEGTQRKNFSSLIWGCLDVRFLINKSWRSKKLHHMKVRTDLSHLQNQNKGMTNFYQQHGLFVIEEYKSNTTHLIPVLGSLPGQGITLDSPWREWLFESQEGSSFIKTLTEKANQYQKQAFEPMETLQSNASLWMIFNKKGKLPHGSYFYPLETLKGPNKGDQANEG